MKSLRSVILWVTFALIGAGSMKNMQRILVVICLVSPLAGATQWPDGSQLSMANIPDRQAQSLNGLWQAAIDPYDIGKGDWVALYKGAPTPKRGRFCRVRV
jgi:hypothetical protein